MLTGRGSILTSHVFPLFLDVDKSVIFGSICLIQSGFGTDYVTYPNGNFLITKTKSNLNVIIK